MRLRNKRPEQVEIAKAGRDGIDGKDGAEGRTGKDGIDGRNGADGRDGLDGKDGLHGLHGRQGEIGPEGKAGPRGSKGAKGDSGSNGLDGWSPILAVVEDGQRRVHQVTGWTGGQGAEPESGWFIGPRGPVDRIADATDIRGSQGPAGAVGGVIVRQGSGGGETGPQGPAGEDGAAGASAYEIAVAEGFVGTEAEWLASLVGAQGDQGIPGADGIDATAEFKTGFPNRTDSEISFDEATRTFTIQPTGASFSIYAAGVEWVYSAAETIVVPNTTGSAFIYFDSETGVISQVASFDISLIIRHVWVAVVYWNATQGLAVLVGDERHGLVMDHDTHLHCHQSFGTTWTGGLGLSGVLVDQSGASNTHAQCGVSDGTIRDEDIEHTIIDGSPQDISPILKAPIIWRIGSDWRIAAVADYPLMYSGRTGTGYTGANGRLGYNLNTAGTWSLTQVANGHVVLAHVLATNDIRYPVITVCGTTDYSTIVNARSAAYDELLSLTGLPFTEFKPLGTLIFETSTSYSNAVKARTRSTDEGGDYIDLRRNLSLGSVGTSGVDVQREVFRIEDPLADLPIVAYPAIAFQATGVPDQYRMHLLP